MLTLAAGLTALLLAACADDPVDEPEPPTSPPAETPLPPRTPPESPPAPPVDPPVAPPTPPTGEVTVSGTLVEGVEPSCILLQTEDGHLFLLFGDPVAELRAESPVTIRGEAQPSMASTCQQGVPFEVAEIVD
ncbi:hypothetical protein JQS43_07205 [Natronosporangium hydrolyticum]|uniref:Lipoprotein n=1 Tax=Natronosporangium hydrolyticum TaxID=2811111 RepID=A0A895YN21_9ACTN|nr:hypothetical protein [Natronosporangium hydrolyticum]QSB16086.1 hypothetical protein JQS43_07205 [Natronosporangium hydrolyticum]